MHNCVLCAESTGLIRLLPCRIFASALSYPPKISTAPKISTCSVANPENTYVLINGVLQYFKFAVFFFFFFFFFLRLSSCTPVQPGVVYFPDAVFSLFLLSTLYVLKRFLVFGKQTYTSEAILRSETNVRWHCKNARSFGLPGTLYRRPSGTMWGGLDCLAHCTGGLVVQCEVVWIAWHTVQAA